MDNPPGYIPHRQSDSSRELKRAINRLTLRVFYEPLLDEPCRSQRTQASGFDVHIYGKQGHHTVACKADDLAAVVEDALDQRIEYTMHQICKHFGAMLS